MGCEHVKSMLLTMDQAFEMQHCPCIGIKMHLTAPELKYLLADEGRQPAVTGL